MRNCHYLSFLFLCLLLSCDFVDIINNEKEEEINTPYKDTSIFVEECSNLIDSTVLIGSHSFIIPKYNVFPKDNKLRPYFCWPILSCTNKESLLVICTNLQKYDDCGEMDILLARKEKGFDNWEIKKIYQTDSINGRSMCPALVIDRETGRIYLFVNYLKNINDYADMHHNDEVGHVYKYSDDDGKTWSNEYDIKYSWTSLYYNSEFRVFCKDIINSSDESKSLWNKDLNKPANVTANKESIICLNCGPNGISLGNGILLVPSCVIVNGIWRSALLIRENGYWRYSRPTLHSGDSECTVYLDNENRVVVDCRTEMSTRRKYYYNMLKDEFTEANPSIIDSYARISTEIINDEGLFYMCYPDTKTRERKNITFYGSRDGIRWKKIFLINPSSVSGSGYTSVSLKDKKLYVSYESQEGIFVLDLTNCRDAIRYSILND